MDATQDVIPKSQPKSRNNLFFSLGCFGFSAKNKEKKKQKVTSYHRKNDKLRFSWSVLRRKKLELNEKVNGGKKVHAEDKIGQKSQVLVSGEIRTRTERLWINLQGKLLKKRQKPAQVKQPLHSKSSQQRNLSIRETSQLRLCLKKKAAVKKDKFALSESLEKCFEPGQNTATYHTLQSNNKKVTIEDELHGAREKNQKPQEGEKLIAKSESIYGLSILMVTLIIMLFGGKLCAMACTSAWIYLIPRLKRAREAGVSVNSDENGSNHIQMNIVDEAYKKKVILDGFLERNNRKVARIV